MTSAIKAALPWGLAAATILVVGGPAFAQAHNPFSVGISEGGGSTSGFVGWVLSQQGLFERSMAGAVRASKADGTALWFLCGLSFLYGVLHAAGPGHGKAVLASYMVANERALRRGLVLSFLAALLQACVAIALVGLLRFVFQATAVGMRESAAAIEKLSYLGIALLGAFLVWRKGGAFLREWRVGAALSGAARSRRPGEFAFAGVGDSGPTRPVSLAATMQAGAARFTCVAAHEHGPSCGHVHAPDPATLGDGFSWREALSTVVAAGARPCSGAILVLVFSLAQGIFFAGVAATLVMALGTAMTTAALASVAVLAKSVALRLAGPRSQAGAIAARGLELAAAVLVLAVGASLLLGIGPLQALS